MEREYSSEPIPAVRAARLPSGENEIWLSKNQTEEIVEDEQAGRYVRYAADTVHFVAALTEAEAAAQFDDLWAAHTEPPATLEDLAEALNVLAGLIVG